MYFFVVSGIDIRIRIPFTSHSGLFPIVVLRNLTKLAILPNYECHRMFCGLSNLNPMYILSNVYIFLICSKSTHTVEKQQYHNSFQDVRLNSGLHHYYYLPLISKKTRHGILWPKLFWPSVRKNRSSDQEKNNNSRLKAENFQNFWDH